MAPANKDNAHGISNRNTSSIAADFDYLETQPFDSHSPTCHDDEPRYFEDTVPFDDDVELETQPMNLAGETQELDFAAGETQPLDDFNGGDEDEDEDDYVNEDGGGAETQLVDEEGFVGVQNDGDGEGSDGTQILEDVDDDEDDVSNDDPQFVENKEDEKVPGESSDEKTVKNADAVVDDSNSSGLRPPRFTFLRAESLLEASLASRSMALKQKANSVMSISPSRQPLAVKDDGETFPTCSEKFREVDQECSNGKDSVEIEGVTNEKVEKVASSAVRKLSYDDLDDETDGPSLSSDYFNEGEGLDKMPIYNGEFPGLSYVNSQEPGELSQVNALDFVDRFLQDNILEIDNHQDTNCVKTTTTNTATKSCSINHVKNVEEKSKSLPSAKGLQSLAKKVIDRCKDVKIGIYDLDDSEDEGGGDIYLRRKEEFFEGETRKAKSMPQFQKTKARMANDNKDSEKKLSIINRRKTAVHSDSKFGMNDNDTTQEAGRKLIRSLGNEFDEQFTTNCSKAIADAQEMLNVGLDTQMAAEAMEALCNADDDANDAIHVTRSSSIDKIDNSSTGKVGQVTYTERATKLGKKRKVQAKSDLQTSGLSKKYAKEVKTCRKDSIMTRSKRSKLDADGNNTISSNENTTEQRKSAGASKRLELGEFNNSDSSDRGREKQLQDDVFHFTPVARRTRKSLAANQSIQMDIPSKFFREENIGIGSLEKSKSIALQASKALDTNSTPKASIVSVSNAVEMDTSNCPRRRRSLRLSKLSDHNKVSEKLVGSTKPSEQPEDIEKSTAGKRKMKTDARTVVKSHVTQSSSFGGLVTPFVDQEHGNILEPDSDEENPGDGSSDLALATPANCRTPVNDASPVCMGNGYSKNYCNSNRSRSCLHRVCRKELQRELRSLSSIRPELSTPSKDSRKRRDMSDVRILYSHHLDDDIVKHQKKILARLGISVASSIADATHFIADQFVRTRNMLEAIAFGKPVVTHSWIESCGQASSFIDERNYILRDAKKEKELGFSMPVSLARASQHPLLEGRRVLITPNVKPSREIISNLVKAVQGQAMERIGRSVMKDNKVPDDLLILSCEEDYASCLPFIEKGAMVYSSELLFNGIVIQKLEYERHRLFADTVKRTRSTIWLKKDERAFLPVTKCI